MVATKFRIFIGKSCRAATVVADGATDAVADVAEGAGEGDPVGKTVGLAVGDRDGLSLGLAVGGREGLDEGVTVGVHDGLSLGLCDGPRVGPDDGEEERGIIDPEECIGDGGQRNENIDTPRANIDVDARPTGYRN